MNPSTDSGALTIRHPSIRNCSSYELFINPKTNGFSHLTYEDYVCGRAFEIRNPKQRKEASIWMRRGLIRSNY